MFDDVVPVYEMLYNEKPANFSTEMRYMHGRYKKKRGKQKLRWADYDEEAEKNPSVISSEERIDLEANQMRYYQGLLSKYENFDRYYAPYEEKQSAMDVLYAQLEAITVDEFLNDANRTFLQQRFTERLKALLDKQIEFLEWSRGDTLDSDEQDRLEEELKSLAALRKSLLGDEAEGDAPASLIDVNTLIANGRLPEVPDEGKLDLSGLGLEEVEGLDNVPNADKVIDLYLGYNDLDIVPAGYRGVFKNLKNVYVGGNPDFDYDFLRQSLARAGLTEQIKVYK